MDHAEQLFALHVFLEAHKLMEMEMEAREMTDEEVAERTLLHVRRLTKAAAHTANAIRQIREEM